METSDPTLAMFLKVFRIQRRHGLASFYAIMFCLQSESAISIELTGRTAFESRPGLWEPFYFALGHRKSGIPGFSVPQRFLTPIRCSIQIWRDIPPTLWIVTHILSVGTYLVHSKIDLTPRDFSREKNGKSETGGSIPILKILVRASYPSSCA